MPTPFSKLSLPKFCSDELSQSSFEEDNGMEFFEEKLESMSEVGDEEDMSSYDMDVMNNYSNEQSMVVDRRNNTARIPKCKNFKLQTSKSPVIDALVYCALTKQGLTVVEDGTRSVQFRLHDFSQYYSKSKALCSKAHPTDDLNSRVKALQRWFPEFPSLKDLGRGECIPCVFTISKEGNPSNYSKLQAILQRQKQLLLAQMHNSESASFTPNAKLRRNHR